MDNQVGLADRRTLPRPRSASRATGDHAHDGSNNRAKHPVPSGKIIRQPLPSALACAYYIVDQVKPQKMALVTLLMQHCG
jgi:hypothetical protein